MADRESRTQGSVKSADRVIDLFELMARWGEHMSHAELAATLEIPKSSLTQLLRSLVSRGYIEYVSATKKYRFGPRLAEIAQAESDPRNLISMANASLLAITGATGESSALNYLNGDETEVVATIYGNHRLITHMRLGDKAPLHLTSAGKLFLSQMTDKQVNDYADRTGLQPATKSSITSLQRLKDQLRQIREKKRAYVFEELDLGVNGVAVPLLDPQGQIVASLNVVVPTVRFSDAIDEVCITTLKREVESLQRKMYNSTRRHT